MAAITSDTTITMADGSTVQTVLRDDGSKSITYVPFAGTPAANAQTMQNRATTALTANATYAAIGSPTNAQVAAQVALLTKECNGLIKLALGLLSDTTGT
jgi:hypothetical protein